MFVHNCKPYLLIDVIIKKKTCRCLRQTANHADSLCIQQVVKVILVIFSVSLHSCRIHNEIRIKCGWLARELEPFMPQLYFNQRESRCIQYLCSHFGS